MSIEIHQAMPTDAPHILNIQQAVWPTDGADGQAVSRIAEVVAQPDHATHLAFWGDTPAGFVDGFMTHTPEGLPRWEVDLLAVHPSFRAKGIAAKLVMLSAETGYGRGAKFARGLVEIENIGSQRTFAHCGFRLEPEACALYVSDEIILKNVPTKPRPLPLNPSCIGVRTLNYDGVWVENDITPVTLLAAIALQSQESYQLTGAVIPLADKDAIKAAELTGFTLVGHYQWWKRGLA